MSENGWMSYYIHYTKNCTCLMQATQQAQKNVWTDDIVLIMAGFKAINNIYHKCLVYTAEAYTMYVKILNYK